MEKRKRNAMVQFGFGS